MLILNCKRAMMAATNFALRNLCLISLLFSGSLSLFHHVGTAKVNALRSVSLLDAEVTFYLPQRSSELQPKSTDRYLEQTRLRVPLTAFH